jgi:hypothetical protein
VKVFVSWSGEKSRDVAQAFHDVLPSILHAVEPFISSKDIRVGTRWQGEVAGELDETDFGLVFVTRENQNASWLNFEAGALAKSVDSSRVVPVAIDLSVAEVSNPLGQFQAITLSKSDIKEMLESMNEACATPIAEENLRKTFEKWWPDLNKELNEILARDYAEDDREPSPARSDRDILEEVLNSVRGFDRVREAPPPKHTTTIDEIGNALAEAGVSASATEQNGAFKVELHDESTAGLLRNLRSISYRHDIPIELNEDNGRSILIRE